VCSIKQKVGIHFSIFLVKYVMGIESITSWIIVRRYDLLGKL